MLLFGLTKPLGRFVLGLAYKAWSRKWKCIKMQQKLIFLTKFDYHGRTQPGRPATGRIIYTKKIWEKLTVLGETDSYSEVDIDPTGEPTTASSSLSKNQTKRSLQ